MKFNAGKEQEQQIFQAELERDAQLKHLKAMGASDEEIYNIIVKGKDMSDHYRGIESLRGRR